MPTPLSWPIVDGGDASPTTATSSAGAVPDAVFARDIALDPETGDLLMRDGDLVLISGAEAIAQHIRMRLSCWLGEWVLDRTVGFPLVDRVFVANPNIPLISSLVRRTIEDTPGVVSVTALALDFDRSARTLSGTFTATSDAGLLSDVAFTLQG